MNREEDLLKQAKNSSGGDTAPIPQIILGDTRHRRAPLLK